MPILRLPTLDWALVSNSFLLSAKPQPWSSYSMSKMSPIAFPSKWSLWHYDCARSCIWNLFWVKSDLIPLG
nr:MAG: hypothetical protein H4RhizoLitter201119_000002 [Mitovirus sp.]